MASSSACSSHGPGVTMVPMDASIDVGGPMVATTACSRSGNAAVGACRFPGCINELKPGYSTVRCENRACQDWR